MNRTYNKQELLIKGNQLIDSNSFQLTDILPSEYVERNRKMTSDVSAWVGKFSYERNPYLKEIINRLSPEDPSRIVAVIKGAQIGFTSGVIEGGIVWIISESPGPILFMCGDKDLTKEVIEKRLEQAIDSCNIRHLIRPNAQRKGGQRTGDTSTSKEFAGGWLLAEGVNNTNKLRNRSIMYGFIDDFDAAEMEHKKEGSFRNLIEMRFASYAFKMKLFYISTPTIKGQSNIENVFFMGDQRYFHIPCPICHEFIVLKWRTDFEDGSNNKAGIHFELDDHGKLKEKSVGYICQKCGAFFKEVHKHEMLMNGKWVATAQPSEEGYYSYHIPSLYAPPGMYNWTHYARKFLECYPNGLMGKPNIPNLKTFVNLCLGQTYEERGKAPKINQLAQNTRAYKIGEVPCKLSEEDGNGHIIMLTCSCDLNGKVDDARLDYEIVAHTETGCTYSVDSGSIGTFQRFASEERRELWTYRNNESQLNIWNTFLKEVLQKQYKSSDGKMFTIFIAGIDTGNFTNYAYTFIDQHQFETVPLMICGLKGENDKIRKLGADTPIFHKSKERENLYILEVNQIKDELADKIELVWNEGSGLSQPAGFLNFPEPGEGKYTFKGYFTQFESEHKVPKLNSDGSEIGYLWQKRHSTVANHFWDCRVYTIAIRDIFVEMFLKAGKYKDISWGKFCEVIKKVK
ncbi:MAG: phage terminase large subunit family protein [Atribacterota bacterium]|nr:phage terminase large subunit family protein [Atribacterota bacterium]